MRLRLARLGFAYLRFAHLRRGRVRLLRAAMAGALIGAVLVVTGPLPAGAQGSPASSWASAPGVQPGAAEDPSGTELAAITAADHSVQVATRSASGSWSTVSDIGGGTQDGPAVVATGTGDFAVVVRGSDTGAYVKYDNGGTWSGWSFLGGQLTGSPAAAADGSAVEVLGRGTDGALWARAASAGSWSSLGGGLASGSGPAGVYDAPGDLVAYVQGTDGAVWQHRAGSWQSIGGNITGSPAASSTATGKLEVFARGTDNAAWHRWWASGQPWSRWSSLGGNLGSGPAVAYNQGSSRADIQDAYALGSDGNLWMVTDTNGSWSGWSEVSPQSGPQTLTVDGNSSGRVFDGVGGLSAGATSRLLFDYPSAQQSQILDYLFKPDYGASLPILKVEIGGDTNSTDGAEPSHMRSTGQVDCNQGYEWWLMQQAKARNPNIKLYALEWGASGWVGGGQRTVWTSQNITYILNWLSCASSHGLQIDYLGGWNEAGYNTAWYETLRNALNQNGYAGIQLVGADNFGWSVANSMASDSAFNQAVSTVGVHYPCGSSQGSYTSCPSTGTAQSLNKPLWASEQGSQQYDGGAINLASALNRQYVDGQMTGTVNWALDWSAYGGLPYDGDGLLLANTPWSGQYVVGKSVWAMAHTSQFTQPGWRYLDSGSTRLTGGGSVVSLRSPTTGDWSSIVETTDASAPQQVTYQLTGGLSTGTVQVWATNLNSNDPSQWFDQASDIQPQGGSLTLTLQPGYVYTLTTTAGQQKGTAASPSAQSWSLPYTDNFDSDSPGASPKYFSDLGGAFQTAPCVAGGLGGTEGTTGQCLQQVITSQPVQWNSIDNYPVTVIGDPSSWQNYQASIDAVLQQAGYVELDGRALGPTNGLTGYHFRISNQGQWSLYSQDATGKDLTLASGTASFGVGTWHHLSLQLQGDTISPSLDGHQLATVADDAYQFGQVGLQTSAWTQAQFDNLEVQPLTAQSQGPLIPQDQMSATATSSQAGYPPDNAIDGNSSTIWHTEYSPQSAPPPQSITVDLGGSYNLQGLLYLPRQDGNPNGTITSYRIYTSPDDVTWTQVGSGTWAANSSQKSASFSASAVRYLRLEGDQGVNGFISAAEINVLGTPVSGPAVPAQAGRATPGLATERPAQDGQVQYGPEITSWWQSGGPRKPSPGRAGSLASSGK